jgi:hypothetical protein
METKILSVFSVHLRLQHAGLPARRKSVDMGDPDVSDSRVFVGALPLEATGKIQTQFITKIYRSYFFANENCLFVACRLLQQNNCSPRTQGDHAR